jgi:hypothetical protein
MRQEVGGSKWVVAVCVLVVFMLDNCEEKVVVEAGQEEEGGVLPLLDQLLLSNTRDCPCGDVYEVKQGETLQSISEKCNDPFIVEANPHISDPDDIMPGQMLRMQCNQLKITLCDVPGALPRHLCR